MKWPIWFWLVSPETHVSEDLPGSPDRFRIRPYPPQVCAPSLVTLGLAPSPVYPVLSPVRLALANRSFRGRRPFSGRSWSLAVSGWVAGVLDGASGVRGSRQVLSCQYGELWQTHHQCQVIFRPLATHLSHLQRPAPYPYWLPCRGSSGSAARSRISACWWGGKAESGRAGRPPVETILCFDRDWSFRRRSDACSRLMPPTSSRRRAASTTPRCCKMDWICSALARTNRHPRQSRNELRVFERPGPEQADPRSRHPLAPMILVESWSGSREHRERFPRIVFAVRLLQPPSSRPPGFRVGTRPHSGSTGRSGSSSSPSAGRMRGTVCRPVSSWSAGSTA